jgi:cephalosporin hydroxylase
MSFDRKEFDIKKLNLIKEQSLDPALKKLANDFTLKSDEYGYAYHWTWLGLPIIQLPQDILINQEIVWRCKPDVIIETGVAWGGSVVFHAALMELLGNGQVIAVDSFMPHHIKAEIMKYPFSSRIHLIEGNSVDLDTIAKVKDFIPSNKKVAAFLDSNHSHEHVLKELRAYGPMVTPGQYLTVYATAIENMPRSNHRPRTWGPGDSPMSAILEYLKESSRFRIEEEIDMKALCTFSPRGRLRCI